MKNTKCILEIFLVLTVKEALLHVKSHLDKLKPKAFILVNCLLGKFVSLNCSKVCM